MSSLTKSPSTSAPALKLPAELWLLIFELLTDPTIDPAGYCNHLNFPYIDLHHRFPCDYPSGISPPLPDLRLVCRYFNALLQQSPSLYMNDPNSFSSSFYMNDPNSAIPATTRALYIIQTLRPCLQRLLADPLISSRIAMLNLMGSEYYIPGSPAAAFHFLCDNASSLPAVRALALCVLKPNVSTAFMPSFWVRLNQGFPQLSFLIVRGIVEPSYCDTVVEFKNLAVLDWDQQYPDNSLQFPCLRHVAFGTRCYPASVPESHSRWPHLESLLLRDLNQGDRFEWRLFPHLRLLGLPAKRMDAFPPLPAGHPLEHLYIFVGTRRRDDHNQRNGDYDLQLTWLKQTIRQLPTVIRISLWFGKRDQNQRRWMEGDFRENDLKRLGFEDLVFPNQNSLDGSHRVLERVKVGPKPSPEILTMEDLAPRRISSRDPWNMLAQLISRRLHL